MSEKDYETSYERVHIPKEKDIEAGETVLSVIGRSEKDSKWEVRIGMVSFMKNK